MTSHVSWVNTDSDALIAGVRAYLQRHGLAAFMDEYYNLLGTRPEAAFTTDNHALAQALGLDVRAERLPFTLPRKDVHAVVYWAKLELDRKFLARYFADPSNLPELSDLQRLFLEWHFLAPRNYSWSLRRDPRRVLLGWNDVAELGGTDDFDMHTNLYGCTGAFALAADGAVQMSHYDDDSLNPAQTAALMDFLRRHPDAKIHTVGVHAGKLAAKLHATRGVTNLWMHIKKVYHGSGYWVGFARRKGRLLPTICDTPISREYLSSTHNNEYGRWFIYGKFGEIFPSPPRDFVATAFAEFRASEAR